MLDGGGISRFGALQEALAEGATDRLVYYAFDLIHLNGYDLSGVALARSKAAVEIAPVL